MWALIKPGRMATFPRSSTRPPAAAGPTLTIRPSTMVSGAVGQRRGRGGKEEAGGGG